MTQDKTQQTVEDSIKLAQESESGSRVLSGKAEAVALGEGIGSFRRFRRRTFRPASEVGRANPLGRVVRT